MAHIDIRCRHGLNLEHARQAVQSFVGQMEDTYDIVCRWEGDTVHFQRPGLVGYLVLDGTEVRIATKLGAMLRPLKGAIEQQIRQRLSSILPDV